MADSESRTLRHLDSLPDYLETDIGRTAYRWVDTVFGETVLEQVVQDMQQNSMTENQVLVLMYRNGFSPFCNAMLVSMRVSGEERLVRQTARAQGSFRGMESFLMNFYQKAAQRFLEQNYGKDVSDFVLPRFNSDNPL